MNDAEKISKGNFSIFILFFVMIFGVFFCDLFLENFGSEEAKKENSFLLKKIPDSIRKTIKKTGKPESDVIKGKGEWFFYRPYVESFKKNEINFGAVEEIVSMKKILEDKGIKLIVLPVPVKAQIHPEALAQIESSQESYNQYMEILKSKDIDSLDLSEILNFPGSYLKGDTHWSWKAVDMVAKSISAKIDRELLTHSMTLKEKKNTIVFKGNLSRDYSELEKIKQIIDESGNLYSQSEDAEILLLGDSFFNIFTQDLHSTEFASGLGQRLAFHLQRPVDKIAVNDGGESGSRQILMDELLSGYDRLKNKKYVIWEFNFSEFSKDKWLRFSLPDKKETHFLKVEKDISVTGKILGISQINRNSVYKDQLVSIKIKVGDKQALFRAYAKKDNKPTRVAQLRIGDEISVLLQRFEKKDESQARTEFGDLDLQLQPYSFGIVESNDRNPGKWPFFIAIAFAGMFCFRFFKVKM